MRSSGRCVDAKHTSAHVVRALNIHYNAFEALIMKSSMHSIRKFRSYYAFRPCVAERLTKLTYICFA